MRTYFKDEDDNYIINLDKYTFECWPDGWSLKAPTNESLFNYAVFDENYDELEDGVKGGFKTLEEAHNAAMEFIKNYTQQ